MHLDDTIAAIASAPGGALRGIVRLSGPQAVVIADRLIVCPNESLVELREPSCCPGKLRLTPPLGDVPALAYVWPTARSYTRQPSVELHLPGSPPLLEAALAAACAAGARLAGPGEFTLRAFLAGRLDLTQAEAVLGVIDAQGQAELDVALGQLAGGLAVPLHALRSELLDLLAHLEAGLDFVEEDIEFISQAELAAGLERAASQVQALARKLHSRGESASPPRVVLIGRPNAGKSSLLNALAADRAAIVSEVAGTTRDFVTRRIALDGRECLLIDTAGFDPAADEPVSAAAQRAARAQIDQADLLVECRDVSQAREGEGERGRGGEEEKILSAVPGRTPVLTVWTKCDLCDSPATMPAGGLATSSRTGVGLDALRAAMVAALSADAAGSAVASTADRSRESLRRAAEALSRARDFLEASQGEEWIAAEVRLALDELGAVAGVVYTDDLLDRVFSRFCIGK